MNVLSYVLIGAAIAWAIWYVTRPSRESRRRQRVLRERHYNPSGAKRAGDARRKAMERRNKGK
ncbi:MAG: hypothetical protein ACQR33_05560 [Candidatus Saccharibacteria bacterium]